MRQRVELDEKQTSVNMVLSRISRAKAELVSPEVYEQTASDFIEEKVARLYQMYQSKLVSANAFDFDDLLMRVVEIFREFPRVLEKYQTQLQYIMVDEYQDTNRAQYELSCLLAQKHRNIFVVGDDDQSIYGWRGADVRNILTTLFRATKSKRQATKSSSADKRPTTEWPCSQNNRLSRSCAAIRIIPTRRKGS